jgi:hypothetical protein
MAKTDRLVRCIGRLSGNLYKGGSKELYLKGFFDSLGIQLKRPDQMDLPERMQRKVKYLSAINNLACIHCGSVARLYLSVRDTVVCKDCSGPGDKPINGQPA